MDDRRNTVLVALQQALLGEVSSRLRAITVSWSSDSIHFDCFYDGPITGEDEESMSSVETEVLAMFPSLHRITHCIVRCDFPGSIPKDRAWAFCRKE